MADLPVDWEFWLALPTVKVWEAVALSLGLNPEAMNQSRDYWKHAAQDHDVPATPLRAEFGLRLRLLVGSLTDPTHFSSERLSADTPANHRVRLQQVGQWLQAIDRRPITEAFLSKLALSPVELPGPSAPAPAPGLPLQSSSGKASARTPASPMHAWQEEQIRRTVRSLGYDPLALPPDDAAHDLCVKSVIRTRCGRNHPVKMRASIFNQAWHRLLNGQPCGLKYRG